MPNSTLYQQTAEYLLQATRFTGLDIHLWLNRMALYILQTQWTASPAMDPYTDASGTHGWGEGNGQADRSIHDGQKSMPIKT